MTLTNEQRLLVNSELQQQGKSMTVAYILLIFLGSLGIHRFYLGRKGSAITQLSLFIVGILTSWLLIGFIPLVTVAIWALVDLFLVPGIVAEENEQIKARIIRDLNIHE